MNSSIFITEDKTRKDIQKYNDLHKKELENNYGIDIEKNSKDKKDLAKYINTKFDSMSLQDMIELLPRCMPEKKIKKVLLEFEFKYIDLIQPKKMDLGEFIKYASNLLNRYQCRAGGFYIEDTQWIVHRQDSVKHDIMNNEVLFENSIDKLDFLDNETQYYIKRITYLLNSLCKDIKVDYNYKESKEDGITWILIWCTHTGIEKDTPEISL